MNPDGRVKVCLGRPGLHRYCHALHNFSCIVANHVQTDDAITGLIDYHFHQGKVFTSGQCVFKRAETTLVNQNVSELLPGFALGQSNCGYLWMAEYCRRYMII